MGKQYLIAPLAIVVALASATNSEAGFRSSGGGFRSSFGSRSFSSRSYSSRSWGGSRSYSSPRPTYRSNTTVEHHYYGGGYGGGSGGFLSGYLWGSLLSHPTPQVAAPVIVTPQVSPNASTGATVEAPQTTVIAPQGTAPYETPGWLPALCGALLGVIVVGILVLALL